MTASTAFARPFAKLFDIDGEQVLFELLPSRDEENLEAGIPDPVISADLGWVRYVARIHLSAEALGAAGLEDLHGKLMDDFDEARARGALEQAKLQWSPEAILDEMEKRNGPMPAGQREKVLAMRPDRFARILEVAGRQVLAITANDLGGRDEVGLVVKVALPGGGVAQIEQPGARLEAFDQAAAGQALLLVEPAPRPSGPRPH